MCNVERMNVVETFANLEEAKLGFVLGKTLVSKRQNVVQQVSSLAELHDDEQILSRLTLLDEFNHVRMTKLSHDIDLKEGKVKIYEN